MPSLQKQQTKFGLREALAYLAESSVTRKFQVERTYGGKLAENVVQATCRDLLCDALLRLETHGYRVVMHIHDEVVVEHPEGQGSLAEVESIVAEVPTWARGCPIGVEGFEARRYRK
jgi:DNA polymerase